MTPTAALSMLDRQLARSGRPATLRRLMPAAAPIDAAVRVALAGYAPEAITGNVVAGDARAILSPTDVDAAGWPGAGAVGDGLDERIPRFGDLLVVGGRSYAVITAEGRVIGDALVRIEMQVRG